VLVNRGAVPKEFIIIDIEMPDECVEDLDPVARIGEDWMTQRGLTSEYGTAWMRGHSEGPVLAFRVPSSILQGDGQYNVLINAEHPQLMELVTFTVLPDRIDVRLP